MKKEQGMDKSWLDWTNENLQRGCDPAEIRDILLKNKFTKAQVRTMMGEKFPAEESKPTGAEKSLVETAAQEANPILGKCNSLLEIQRDLARLNPKSRTIDRRKGLTSAEFLEKYYSANRPVIMTDLMTYWQAMEKWTPEYLKQTCGGETVEIMAARNTNPEYEVDDAPHRKQIKFSRFVDMVTAGGETNDYYLTARNDFFARPGTRPLLDDIEAFSEYLKQTDGNGVFMWYGPKGTVTPLHHDMMNIFMAQVKGRKHIRLVPANEIELVYNHYSVYSRVDAANPDYDKFPKFRFANVIDFELAPGEVLFVPVGWWHWVKALDTSITVSFIHFLFPNEFKWEHPGGGKIASGY